MNNGSIDYLIERLLEYAGEAIVESNENIDDVFLQGKRLAYMEILGTINTELQANGEDYEGYVKYISKLL